MTEGAQHIEVDLAVETDADRRLKEWEAKRNGCPIWKMRLSRFGDACPYFYYMDETGVLPIPCNMGNCMGRHWGWR